MNKRYIIKGLFVITLLGAVAGKSEAQTRKVKNRTTDSVTIKNGHQINEPGRFFTVPKTISTAAVSSISGETSYQTTTPNITNTLYGKLSGLTVIQTSGEPGNDEALSGIRGIGSYGFLGGSGGYHAYKIFVDGFETNRNYFRSMSPSEIESIAVLKDAAALATFGLRGGNGVLYITTKRGNISKPTVELKTRTGFQSALNINKPLNSYDYASFYNQAISNDNSNVWTPKYSAAELQAYQNGTGVNVDWFNEALKDNSPYYDADVVFRGGDSTARYSVVLNYINQKGLFNVSNADATSNQMLKRYNLRTNLDFNMFNIFEARIDLGGRIEDEKHPNYSTGSLWSDLVRYPSNIYPIKDGENWSGTALYPNNPVASLNALGWASNHNRILQGNFGLKEKLNFITPGLYISQAYSFNSFGSSTYNKTANYQRYFNGATTTTDQISPLRATGQTAAGQEDWKQLTATLGYERQFGNYALVSALNYHESDYRGDGLFSFAYHYKNISGRANYSFKNKYIGEFGFSYFGSDAYAPGNRWGFYPAVSAAWVVSNEDFLKDNKTVGLFKVRASVGKSGTADTEGAGSPVNGLNGRFLYQQYYANSGTFYMGDGSANGNSGLSPLFIANSDIFAETSLKYNLGTDINLLNKLDLSFDVFLDKRSGIITLDNSIPSLYGNNISIKNLGKQTNKGLEATAMYSDKAGKLGYTLTGMLSYNKNKIDYMAEITPAYSYNAITGRSYGTYRGLIAEGYYQLNDFNADGSLKAGLPVPAFGTVQPGDLKYKNLNSQDDNIINENDITAIGKSPFPRLTYSFGGGLNYKGFDLSALFQGSAASSVNILNGQTIAFVNNANAFAIAKDSWAYYPEQNIDTRASAKYPRLTTLTNNNNYRSSSFWIKSNDFLRLRNVELGYTINKKAARMVGLNKARIFVNAVNPITWSSLLKNYDLDPETLNNYPALKSYNAGVSVTF